MKNGNINIQTTDKSITLATYPKYDIFTVVHYNSENELLNGYDWDDDG
ncbi:hypothetical protein [Herbiconiux daphne]|nr:hypothetical protein [Herbiconiux daphne]